MVGEDVAYLRPWQVYRILDEHDLLGRGTSPTPEALKRPPEPDHPDQVWHVDLMYLYIKPWWYCLVDILDGYSRLVAHPQPNGRLERLHRTHREEGLTEEDLEEY